MLENGNTESSIYAIGMKARPGGGKERRLCGCSLMSRRLLRVNDVL